MSAENETTWMQRLTGRLPWYTVPALLIGVPLLAILIGRIFPPFYDNVLWKYYWGPIVTDAAQRSSMTHNGVVATSGYNLVNTLSWAVLMGVCIVGLTQLMTAIRAKMSNTVIWGATAWVVSGAVWHVLQDTQLFEPPFEYLFITPPIYLLFAVGGILSLLIGVYLERVAAGAGNERALQKLWLIMSIGVLLYTLAWAAEWGQVTHYVNPVHVALFAALNFFVVAWRVARTGRIDAGEMILLLSLAPFLVALDYIWLFMGEPWDTRGAGLPSAIWLAPLLAGATTLAVYLVARWRGADSAKAVVYTVPVNLLLIFSQVMDGFGTALGIDLAGYVEKHVLSGFLIVSFRDLMLAQGWQWAADHATFLIFVPIKLLISLAVVYAIDVYSKEDVEKYPTLIGFIKFAIIMVGIGPGVRNVVRLALGV